MFGLLSDDPQQQAGLAMALAMLSGSGASPQRRTFGEILGGAGMAGMQQYRIANELSQRQKDRDEERRIRQMKMDELLETKRQQQEGEAKLREYLGTVGQPDYPEGSTMMTDRGRELMANAPVKQFDPLAAYRAGVPLSMVSAAAGMVPKPGEGFTLKPAEVRFDQQGRRIAGVPAEEPERWEQIGNGLQRSTKTGKIAPVGHAPGTSVNLSVNTERTLLGQVADLVGQDIAKTRDAAITATGTIDHVNRVRTALDSGKAITGPGAEIRLGAAQVANLLGITGPDAVTQTRTIIQGMAKMALGARSSLKGQGQVSDFEGKLLQRAEAGDINMTAAEIRTIADVADRQARKLIAQNKKNATTFSGNPNAAILTPYFTVEEPPVYQSPTLSVDDLVRKYGGG